EDLREAMDTNLWGGAITYTFEVFALGGGAVALFLRKMIGRWLATAGAAVHIVANIVMTVLTSQQVGDSVDAPDAMTDLAVGLGVFVVILLAIPAIATIILALVPPTGRWLSWKPTQPQGFPQY